MWYVAALRACVVVRVTAPMATSASALTLLGLLSDSGRRGESMMASIKEGRVAAIL